MKAKYLIPFLLLISIGCINKHEQSRPKYHIGQIVGNGYCKGMIASVIYLMDYYEYYILDAECGNRIYNHVILREDEIK